MTFAFDTHTVTTWGELDGQQLWRCRTGDRVAHFTTPDRDVETWWLHVISAALLGLPVSENGADLLAGLVPAAPRP